MIKILPIFISFLSTVAIAAPNEGADGSERVFYTNKAAAMKGANLEKIDSPVNDQFYPVAAKINEDFKTSHGEIYGGGWVEYDEYNIAYQVIALTEPIDSKKSFGLHEKTKIVYVRNNSKTLDYLKEDIAKRYLEQNPGDYSAILSTGVDVPKNKVIVGGRAEDRSIVLGWLEVNNYDLEIIEFVEQNAPVQFFGELRGGTRIAGSTLPAVQAERCTLGFTGLLSNQYPVAITAGHCASKPSFQDVYFNMANAGQPAIRGDFIGSFIANSFNDGIDAVTFGNANGAHAAYSQIYTSGLIQNVKAVLPVNGGLLYAPVCSFGGTTGWRCGSLASYSSWQLVNGKAFNFAIANICGGFGDSGGPVVTSNFNAIGIYAGALGPVGSTGSTCGDVIGGSVVQSVFQPLTAYLEKWPAITVKIN